MLDAINTEDHTHYAEVTTHAEKLAFVMACYEAEFNHKYNQARHPNEQTRFAHWLAGLPSVLDIPFYNYHRYKTCEAPPGSRHLPKREEHDKKYN